MVIDFTHSKTRASPNKFTLNRAILCFITDSNAHAYVTRRLIG